MAFKQTHDLKILLILITFSVFHFEISGNSVKDEHPSNIEFIWQRLFVSQTEILGKTDNLEHP